MAVLVDHRVSTLVLADTDEAAVTGVRPGSGEVTVLLADGDAGEPENARRYDEIVIALAAADLAQVRNALASSRGLLADGGTVRLSLAGHPHRAGVAPDFSGALDGYRLIEVEFRDDVPYAVLVPGADDPMLGARLAGVAAGALAAGHGGADTVRPDDDAADLAGQVRAGKAVEEQLSTRTAQLQEQLAAARAEARELRTEHDKLRRSKLGRLTLGYWGLKRRLRKGRRGDRAASKRLIRVVAAGAVALAWLVASALVLSALDWSVTRWLVLQLIVLVAGLLVLAVRNQRTVLRQLADLRVRGDRDRKALADLTKGVAAVRSRVDAVGRRLDTVGADVGGVAETADLHATTLRSARSAVADLTRRVDRLLPEDHSHPR